MEAAESIVPADSPLDGLEIRPTLPLDESLVTASQPYVGQWNRLVSTTNWQKGRIIGAWRESLAVQGLAVNEYSDEAWARLVGGVTGQHVGRLRRVFARFGETHEQFAGLYWSHFQAALDWSDAEMWLQGAVSSGWSVARAQRLMDQGMARSDGRGERVTCLGPLGPAATRHRLGRQDGPPGPVSRWIPVGDWQEE